MSASPLGSSWKHWKTPVVYLQFPSMPFTGPHSTTQGCLPPALPRTGLFQPSGCPVIFPMAAKSTCFLAAMFFIWFKNNLWSIWSANVAINADMFQQSEVLWLKTNKQQTKPCRHVLGVIWNQNLLDSCYLSFFPSRHEKKGLGESSLSWTGEEYVGLRHLLMCLCPHYHPDVRGHRLVTVQFSLFVN